MRPSLVTTDILILGSGLSGLRAALSARQAAPDLATTIACLPPGPSGSSFTNRNNALGYQLLDTDERKTSFVQEALSLAPPGSIDQKLVTLLADESEPRFRELEDLAPAFRRESNGALTLFTGCGSQDKRAVVFDNLSLLFNQYLNKTNRYGCTFLTNTEILGILKSNRTAIGAWGIGPDGSLLTIRARSVILALGGPAPLFPNNIAGSGNPGLAWGMLAECGVKMANTPYIQFMWGDRSGNFLSPASLLAQGNSVERENGSLLSPGDQIQGLASLVKARALHCPLFYDRPDTALDHLLMNTPQKDGFTRIRTTGGMIEATLHAHAANGGAVINEHGETSLRNLFALGECATGMHGANRLGGAMVLATQVFGHRAGIAAAKQATHTPLPSENDISQLTETKTTEHTQCHREWKVIRNGLGRYGLPYAKHGEGFARQLTPLLTSKDRRVRLAALTAQAIMGTNQERD